MSLEAFKFDQTTRLSPLSAEIVNDLPVHFPNGATVTDLIDWLGERSIDIKAALTEACDAGLIHKLRQRYFDGPNPKARPCNCARDASICRLLDMGLSHGQIAQRLQITRGVVSCVAARRKGGR